ncbi:peptide chain release factor N(5)-glutamine methyltransferase [Dasania sp. GY-MA-18]|uniref:Release factor glutamine methyltransferase n=1 Tax=Dasania phycosphaerae TaxID=2950436 RepID=A0A9J6RIW3_9GAMM|nr:MULTISPECIES: peptide chain release factor N(5)-glutamine methyltransferase [Dasania]MCR8921489.1 peptide chain release factor N(5)-glutamine methyltransferase [Dasania sp. GY-MA-18]MCZ0863917.1 peptide chain release factor N(5)-glutamine methyltransferase [Dasania phycosphaerae]MCZ0867645.1 peptide chain release factor N(5)-glutamine methyltransferase [Dasania phycosphaerae]
MSSIAELLASRSSLAAVSDTPGLDVELLLAHSLEQNRTYLKTWPEREVSAAQQQQFQTLLQRRQAGEPIAHLLGSRGFWTLDLQVNPSTLIPRPETELLVEIALEKLAAKPNALVLDLGTGTGAIALAIASENSLWQVLGCDLQREAVALAERNGRLNKINNAKFLQSDWFTDIPKQQFDLIVSNPPYIDANDPHLSEGDVRFEPRSALVAGKQGLADIEHISVQAPAYLKPGAWLLFEHGYEQAEAVRALLKAHGYVAVATLKDIAGMDRVTLGQYAAANEV